MHMSQRKRKKNFLSKPLFLFDIYLFFYSKNNSYKYDNGLSPYTK